jgi:uncharacterized 2Fe-2S/4Fe-4S cluster protein (DUF4445 family)
MTCKKNSTVAGNGLHHTPKTICKSRKNYDYISGMIKINIISGSLTETVTAEKGASLLDILRQSGYEVYAACGGKGRCGKCTVRVKGEGTVLSCSCYPDHDIEVILPDRRETKILTSQTEYLLDLPYDEGHHSNLTTQPYGVAADIGTTTVVLYFVDLVTGRLEKIASLLNPQAAYGADVISRITCCQSDPSGLQKLQQAIVGALNGEIRKFTAARKLSPENIERVVIAGNTTMLHILLGEDPVPIALAPFKPRFTERQRRAGAATGLAVNEGAEVVTLPSISAFVGADIVAGLAALNNKEKNYLFLDIGTNGEIALVTGDEIFACAAAAGPAFEGASLTCGMNASAGAISSFARPGEYRVIGNTQTSGICGSGIVDIVAWLTANGIVDETGYMRDDFMIDEGTNVRVTQSDIREIQLAKSAIYSGMKILAMRRGLKFSDLDALFLAGGFGNYISIESALQIGMLPDELTGRIYAVGNSAGIGALQYLKSGEFIRRTDEVVARASYLELSDDEEFPVEFAMNMEFRKPGVTSQ